MLIYHGDNYGLKFLDPKLMNNGNNQEGIGIYFSSDKKVAEHYGKYIITMNINKSNFLPSRGYIGDHVSKNKLIGFLKEGVFRDLSYDYGLEYLNYNKFYEMIKDEQIRNFQITIVEQIGINEFLYLWKKYINKQGLYHEEIYSVLWGKINKEIKEEIIELC